MVIQLLRSTSKYREALKICQENNLNNQQPLLLLDIADEHYLREEYIKAESNYDQVLKQALKTQKDSDRANIGIAKI